MRVLATGQAQEKVVYSFGANPTDGAGPNDGLLFDSAGNLYGTTQAGGAARAGGVFELSPQLGGNWQETILYSFCSLPDCEDGAEPRAGLISDDAGNIYGTTVGGGAFSGGTCGGGGCGTVFELSPPGNSGGAWTETVIWNFKGNLNNDGGQPYSRLAWDGAGSIYGTTIDGGSEGSYGTVFKLSLQAGGGWSEAVLYAFCPTGRPCPDGVSPFAGVTFDKAGNLYGTAEAGGFRGQWGTVYELSPSPEGNWTEVMLHQFMPQTGGNPFSQVSVDQQGNLYGIVSDGPQGSDSQCGGAWGARTAARRNL